MKEKLQRLNELWAMLLAWVSFVAPTVTRIVLGYAMWVDGDGKLQHLDRVTTFFSSLFLPFTNTPLPHPELQAHAIAAVEYYGGFLLMIGLFTRPVSLMLAGAMVGAVLMSDSKELISKWSDGTPTDATSFCDFVLALWTLMYGAGPLSVDGLVAFFYREWTDEQKPLRERLGGIIACNVVRGLIVLLLLALVPVSDGLADRMVHLGIKTQQTRAPREGEFDENPPAEVVEYPPDLLHLGLYAVLLAGIGGGAYMALRHKQ